MSWKNQFAPELQERVKEVEEKIQPILAQIHETALSNQKKVLDSFRKKQVSDHHSLLQQDMVTMILVVTRSRKCTLMYSKLKQVSFDRSLFQGPMRSARLYLELCAQGMTYCISLASRTILC